MGDACPSNGFKHSPGAWQGANGYGENLSWGTNQSAQGAVDNWYREIGQYNFKSPAYSNAVGHFTQLIWRNSKHLAVWFAVHTLFHETIPIRTKLFAFRHAESRECGRMGTRNSRCRWHCDLSV